MFSLGWDSPPDWGCTPKQPDSPESPREAGPPGATGLSPSAMPPSNGPRARIPQRTTLHATTRRGGDSRRGLRPFRSPLLRASGFVSFPPLSDMLKFSGWPRRRQVRFENRSLSKPPKNSVDFGRSRFRANRDFQRLEPSSRSRNRRRWTSREGRRNRFPGDRSRPPGARGRPAVRPTRSSSFRVFLSLVRKNPAETGWTNDADADVLSAIASSTMCVRKFHGSRRSAIHDTYRVSRRSSSTREPSHPPSKVSEFV